MSIQVTELERRASVYARQRQVDIIVDPPLGSGTDGHVWSTSDETAVKVFAREENYVVSETVIGDCWSTT